MDIHLDLGQQHPVAVTRDPKINWWKVSEAKDRLTNTLEQLHINLDQPSTWIWEDATNGMRTTAIETMGKTKPGRKYIDKQVWWWTAEIQEAVKKKKVARKVWWNTKTDAAYQEYRSFCSMVKREVARVTAAHFARLYEALDEPGGENGIYRIAKVRNQATLDIGQVKHVRDVDGWVLHDPEVVQ